MVLPRGPVGKCGGLGHSILRSLAFSLDPALAFLYPTQSMQSLAGR